MAANSKACYDGRWPEPTLPCAADLLRGIPRRPHGSMPRSWSAADLELPGWFLTRPEKERLSGSRSFLFYELRPSRPEEDLQRRQVQAIPQRYAVMRSCSAGRFAGQGGEMLGLFVGTPPQTGPGSYFQESPKATRARSGVRAKGTAAFESGELRVPLNSTSWLLLRSRNSELRAATLAADDRGRLRHANGCLKGPGFSRDRRF
mmetsp:Transcript_33280/g.72633  ORF Transcript_33280/g.72633 Transcript_33280/m.72633 type:complete len:204 (-) Transcript_33280:91-702(-)